MAYANKKYHSGTICAGVDNGLAMTKLSGSPRRFGEKRTTPSRNENKATKPARSLIVKYQWKGILSADLDTPSGLLLPVMCSRKIWTITSAVTNNGTIK